MFLEQFLNKISIWCIIFPVLIGILKFRSLTRDSVYIVFIVVLAAIPQLLSAFIDNSSLLNIVYNIYTPIEFFLLFLLFKNNLYEKRNKRILLFQSVFYLITVFIIITFFSISKNFISEWVCLNNLIYTSWILLVIIEQYKINENKIDSNTSFFWYLIGLLLYAPCTLLIFSLWYYIRNNPGSVLNNLWIIHHFFNILMYALFSIGLIKDKKIQSL